ncbi:hypothetical protein MZG59_21070, partial [Escherichia coli]|nr:hypothetical protein [Escherichia coli]MCK3021109.1 hypothetical protein [Escherichia coli]MCK3058287.1 hypothetical protein [Escherichia coli]MCK3067373.1 hypothetical protein [Escherichia coli]
MNAVLSVQGASAPVKKKSFFSKFTRLNMLRLARAVIPAAVLMMGNDSNLLIVFYVQIMPDDFVMQLHR